MRSRPLGLKVGMVRVSEARPLENVFERGLRRHSIFTGPESNPFRHLGRGRVCLAISGGVVGGWWVAT